MKLLVLQHVPFEGPAAIKTWAERHNHPIQHHCCTSSQDYPNTNSFDCCIIMGGPMGVNDDLPWMAAELDFIKQTIGSGKFVLGICLGAQLIARAMGADVKKGPQREIGWFPVRATAECQNSQHWLLKTLPPEFMPLHWHGDTFDIPTDAVRIWESEAYPNQAFYLHDRIIGLQFHLEFDTTTAIRVAEAGMDELLLGGPAIQPLKKILEDEQRFYDANELMYNLLDGLHTQFIMHNL